MIRKSTGDLFLSNNKDQQDNRLARWMGKGVLYPAKMRRSRQRVRARFVLILCLLTIGPVIAAHGSETVTYTYDALGRLVQTRHSGSVNAGIQTNVTYDAAGNRGAYAIATTPGIPSSISVPSGSTTGGFTVSWGSSTGTVTAYQLYEATNLSFWGQSLVYSSTGTSKAISGKGNGTYYYRVRGCDGSVCSGYRTGANGVAVEIPIQALNPSFDVTTNGQITSITTLADLNGNSATIQSFVPQSCHNASATIQSGGQSVSWYDDNYYIIGCEIRQHWQCSASYVIRNSNTGQTHSGSAAVTVYAQGRHRGGVCP